MHFALILYEFRSELGVNLGVLKQASPNTSFMKKIVFSSSFLNFWAGWALDVVEKHRTPRLTPVRTPRLTPNPTERGNCVFLQFSLVSGLALSLGLGWAWSGPGLSLGWPSWFRYPRWPPVIYPKWPPNPTERGNYVFPPVFFTFWLALSLGWAWAWPGLSLADFSFPTWPPKMTP